MLPLRTWTIWCATRVTLAGSHAMLARTYLILALSCAAPLAAQQEIPAPRTALGLTAPLATVMIVGTHHFSNPNQDMVKTDFDDPRSPRRQAEVMDLVRRLAAFKPTRIALEASYGSTEIVEQYARYVNGQYVLTANEVDQVGFRLAKQLSLSTVYPIDYRIGLDFGGPLGYAAANGQAEKAQAMKRALEGVGTLFAAMSTKSIVELYRIENEPAALELNQSLYVYLAEIGRDSVYVGADQMTRWYARNARIATNILRTAAPGERVLVLIGTGHAYLLNEILSRSPSVRLEPVLALLK